MERFVTLLIAAACLAVLLTAPFACEGLACADTAGAGWATDSHDDGVRATVKPVAPLAPASPILSLAHVAANPTQPETVVDSASFSAGLPLRI